MNTKRTDNTEAPPLLLPRLIGRHNGDGDLVVTFVEVLDHLLALLLNLSDLRLLLDDERVHVLEELRQLDHLLLDLGKGSLPVLHGVEHGARLAPPVALHHRLLENLLAAGRVLDNSAHLRLGRIWPHNPILPCHLILCLFAELRLNLLEGLDGLLQSSVYASNLALVLRLLGVSLALHLPYPLR
jgi:hypothetical protein